MKKFFDKQLLQNVYENFETFKKSPEALPFRYPCQGVGRFEYMLPFAPPFNTSIVYQDRRLHDILFEFLQSRFKLELQTIITSEPGAGFQRFHQGHQGLFHPSERLPPYAVVVGVTLFLKMVFIVVRIFEKQFKKVPLVDVDQSMGPTEFCPRKKLRFYQGCNVFLIAKFDLFSQFKTMK